MNYRYRIDRIRVGFKALPLMMALTMAMSLGIGCGDDDPPASEDVVADVVADVVEDGGNDQLDQADQVEDSTPDVEVQVDIEEDDEPHIQCPLTMSCYDAERDMPRTAICTNAGYPAETMCVRDGEGDYCCVPPFACETNQDCVDAREEERLCPDERYECRCNVIDGSCTSGLCAADSECEGDDVCRDGLCTPAGDRTGLEARIITPSGFIADGQELQLLAVAFDPDETSRVFDDEPISWESSDGDIVSVSVSGLATGGADGGTAEISATVTSNALDPGDTISITHAIAPTVALRVIVLDENTFLPVADATVLVEPDGGDPLTGTTDEDGIALFEDEQEAAFNVSVFDPDYAYVTYVAVEADQDDLMFVLPPVAFTEVTPESTGGGEDRICEEHLDESLCYDLEGVVATVGTVDLSTVANTGEIDVGLTGYALGNSLLDLNFELIVGPNIDRDLSGGPIPIDGLSEIPGGVILAFNEDPLVGTYNVAGLPGDRVLWSIGGRVSLSQNPNLLPDILEQVDGELDIGQIIAAVLPLFSDFYSGIDPNITLEFSDDEDASVLERNIAVEMPVGIRISIDPPLLPETVGRPLETALFLGGTTIPGQGFVPLGLTAAVDGADDSPLDRVLDGDPSSEEIDAILLSMAPMHSGIRSPETRYTLVSVALSLDETGEGENRENTTGLILRMEPGEPFPTELVFDHDDYPALAEETTYDPGSRTVTIVANDDFAPDFNRVLFKGDRARIWQVYLPIDVTTYVAPDFTDTVDGWEDRAVGGKASMVSLTLIDEDDLTYEQLISASAPGLERLIDFTDAFTVVEIGD